MRSAEIRASSGGKASTIFAYNEADCGRPLVCLPTRLMGVGPDHRPSPARRWRTGPLPGLGLAGLAIAIYLAALRNPFIYDDRITVVENPSIRHFGDLRALLHFNLFRPLANVSFAIDHALWGLDPVGFHLTNVLLLSVALVFALVSHLACQLGTVGLFGKNC